jgi:hypothetical protein
MYLGDTDPSVLRLPTLPGAHAVVIVYSSASPNQSVARNQRRPLAAARCEGLSRGGGGCE